MSDGIGDNSLELMPEHFLRTVQSRMGGDGVGVYSMELTPKHILHTVQSRMGVIV